MREGTEISRKSEDAGCTIAKLVPGARVHDAEADITADGLVFEEIEMLD